MRYQELFEFIPAVEAAVGIFHQQEEKREYADNKEPGDCGDECPLSDIAF
jgi:hypothetical protein